MTTASKKRKSNRVRKWTTGVEGMDRLLQDKAMSHNQGFFHYTILRHLAKILTPVEIGDKKCYLMKMSPAENLNDRAEKRRGNKAYVLSLLHGPEESVAMWTVYGVPKKEAVRLRLPKKAIAKWWKKTQKNCSSLFFVKDGQSGKYKPVQPFRIRFADVLYIVRKNSKFPYIGEHDGILYGAPDKKSWEEFSATQPDVGLDLFFKNRGWSYERETRLVAEFDTPHANPGEAVYVNFTDILKATMSTSRETNDNILLGPWFDERTFLDNLRGNTPKQPADFTPFKGVVDSRNRSRYFDELRMKTNCDFCEKDGKKSDTSNDENGCNCPYTRQ